MSSTNLSRKKLNAFRGQLKPAQIAEGINAANTNAMQLTTDAELLFAAGSYSTASSIAILAIEEAGKTSILRSLALARTDSEANSIWKEYRTHTYKNASWILPELLANGARKLADFRSLYDKQEDHPFVLDQLKQLGFYTDCLGNAQWSKPSEAISKELSESLVLTARLLARERKCSEHEVELWIEHIGPVWKQDMRLMEQALVTWYAAMQAAGLIPNGSNSMAQFISQNPN